MCIVPVADLSENKPADICNYLEYVYFLDTQQLIVELDNHIKFFLYKKNNINKNKYIFYSFFLQLKDEVEQLINNDISIVFPLIRNDKGTKPCPARKLPIISIIATHQKILQQITNIQQQADEITGELIWGKLENNIRKIINIKENTLFPKIEKLFNQKCSGVCRAASALVQIS